MKLHLIRGLTVVCEEARRQVFRDPSVPLLSPPRPSTRTGEKRWLKR